MMWKGGQDCSCLENTGQALVEARKFMLSSQLQHKKNGGDDDEVNINYQCQF